MNTRPQRLQTFILGIENTDVSSFYSLEQLINMYVTHYVSKAVMGAKIGGGIFFAKTNLDELKGSFDVAILGRMSAGPLHSEVRHWTVLKKHLFIQLVHLLQKRRVAVTGQLVVF
jgi:hypothetical protein